MQHLAKNQLVHATDAVGCGARTNPR